MRIAITGAGGRLGRALYAALLNSSRLDPIEVSTWSRPHYDLDDPRAAERLVARDRPDLVIHAAAWTDVDGCAADPVLAERRNGTAVAELASACARSRVDLIFISTNEVFDGRRADGRGYRPDDPVGPINAYGASKLAGEIAAGRAFDREPPGAARLGIVRTAWLFGAPGGDFPEKILRAGRRAAQAGEALRVVADEIGCPTYAPDLAAAIAELVAYRRFAGIRHVVNEGVASRAEWAEEVIELADVAVPLERVPSSGWRRASTPPAWAVLEPGEADVPRLRSWREAIREYIPFLLQELALSAATQ